MLFINVYFPVACHEKYEQYIICLGTLSSSAGHYRDNVSRHFIVIIFSLSFIAIKKNPPLSIYRYRDTFVPKSAIIYNKIQQVIEKQFHT